VTDWIEIKASFETCPEDWSIYVDAFDRFGCPGSIQTDRPPTISAYLVAVEGSREQASKLSDELKRLGAHSVSKMTVPEEDWSETWKQFFKPRRVGQRFVIRPTWEEYESRPGDNVIVLDPGQAFGTGDHPTTRLCLELMEKAEIEGKTVADVGCGSGILSIGALQLCAKSVEAVDIDPLSIEVAKANATLNNVDYRCIAGDGFNALSKPTYDVIVSNIISAVLIRLAPDAAAHVVPGGKWIVSGIIRQNWDDVRCAAEKAGFKWLDRVEEDDWVAGTFLR
jgi:ribosomal protein L11 methyltransferase